MIEKTVTHFPFDTIRAGQQSFFEDAKRTFAKKEVLLAYAPTGIGKTAAALSAALDAKHSEEQKILFVTPRQSQHAVVIETIRRIEEKKNVKIKVIDLIGKQDMCTNKGLAELASGEFQTQCLLARKSKGCPYFPLKTSLGQSLLEKPHHAEEVIKLGKLFRSCPYYSSVDASKKATVIIADYNYAFSDHLREHFLENSGLEWKDILLIVDEAHNVPGRVQEILTMRLDAYLVDNCLKQAKEQKAPKNLQRSIEMIKQVAKQFTSTEKEKEWQRDTLINQVNQAFSQAFIKPFTYVDFLAELDSFEPSETESERASVLDQLYDFLLKWNQKSKHWCRIQQGRKLQLLDLDVAYHVQKIATSCAGTVFMSGTLYPPQDYGAIMGLEGSKVHYKSYESPFPEENLTIFVEPRLTTKYTDRSEAVFDQMAKRIEKLEQESQGNTACFFPSYELLRQVQQHISTKRTILQESSALDKRDIQDIISQLHASKTNLLLAVMGGSLSEGIDFHDQAISSIGIVGLPLAPPSLELTKRVNWYHDKNQNGTEWMYHLPAMNRVLQAAGRAIRSETDQATILLLDARFNEERFKKLLPKRYQHFKTFV